MVLLYRLGVLNNGMAPKLQFYKRNVNRGNIASHIEGFYSYREQYQNGILYKVKGTKVVPLLTFGRIKL